MKHDMVSDIIDIIATSHLLNTIRKPPDRSMSPDTTIASQLNFDIANDTTDIKSLVTKFRLKPYDHSTSGGTTVRQPAGPAMKIGICIIESPHIRNNMASQHYHPRLSRKPPDIQSLSGIHSIFQLLTSHNKLTGRCIILTPMY